MGYLKVNKYIFRYPIIAKIRNISLSGSLLRGDG